MRNICLIQWWCPCFQLWVLYIKLTGRECLNSQKRGLSGSHSLTNSRSSSIVASDVSSRYWWARSKKKKLGMKEYLRCFILFHAYKIWLWPDWQTSLEKMICGPPDGPSWNMITPRSNHKQSVKRPQMTEKKLKVESFVTLTLSTSIILGPCKTGLMRQAMETTGTNLSNVSSIQTPRYQSDRKRRGDRPHHGVHDKLHTDKSSQLTT